MKFKISKQVIEEIEIHPPYYCKDNTFHYYVAQNGSLITVSNRTIVVNDLNNPFTSGSIRDAVSKSIECTKFEFLQAFDEAAKVLAAAFDQQITLSALPY